jgi:hypothetical protein
MLIQHGNVNNDWKDQARRASEKINSHGLFTNIEDTLRDATWDWNKTDPKQHRSLILLTDGLVDISSDTQINHASLERILNEILLKLQRSGINIHTIALSNDADETLLRQLSSATRVSFTRATTAQELERVFLRMFETSTKAETLPLKNKTIQVDSSIREITLLIFHQSDTPVSGLIDPDSMQVMVTIDEEEAPLPGPAKHHNEWQLKLENLDSNKRHSLVIDISGTLGDRNINTRLALLFFGKDMTTPR